MIKKFVVDDEGLDLKVFMQSFTRCMLGDKDEVDLKQCKTVQQTKIDYFVVVVVVFYRSGGIRIPKFQDFLQDKPYHMF